MCLGLFWEVSNVTKLKLQLEMMSIDRLCRIFLTFLFGLRLRHLLRTPHLGFPNTPCSSACLLRTELKLSTLVGYVALYAFRYSVDTYIHWIEIIAILSHLLCLACTFTVHFMCWCRSALYDFYRLIFLGRQQVLHQIQLSQFKIHATGTVAYTGSLTFMCMRVWVFLCCRIILVHTLIHYAIGWFDNMR